MLENTNYCSLVFTGARTISDMSTAMMQNLIEMKKKAIDAKTFEIDLIEEAGIFVTVKVKANPNPKLAAIGGSSEVPKKEIKPWSSRIIRLSNVVKEYDFESDEAYEDLLADLTVEGGEFGKLVNVVIPRPNPDHHLTPPGVGKVFLEYADLDAASTARLAFNGKPFENNIVVADYYPEFISFPFEIRDWNPKDPRNQIDYKAGATYLQQH